jgi:hypothetical protein
MTTAAQQLAHWIEIEHPDFFRHLYLQIATARNQQALSRATLRGFGDDGGDFVSSDVTVDVSADATPAYTVTTIDPSTLSAPALDTGTFSTPINNPGGDSGSFLDSLGSGIASAATAVGSALTNPQVLSGVANLGAAYFKNQQVQATAAVQSQILQSQIARAQAGFGPAPITYITGPNGQPVPVYASTTGIPAALSQSITAGQSQQVMLPNGQVGYTIPTNILGGLSSMTLGSALPWLLIAGAALVLLSR